MNYKKFIAPLTGMAIFACASGYLATLVPLRVKQESASEFYIGILASMYYLGLLAGSFRTEQIVSSVGHIRSFSGFIALLGASIMMMPLAENPYIWLILRFVNGIGIAGIYVVVESWLLSDSNKNNRGKLISFYMVSLYGASSLGQLFISHVSITSLTPFILISIMLFLSIIPPCMTRLPSPELQPTSGQNILELFKITPSGLTGAFISGVILGSLYGLLPIYIERTYKSQILVGQIMAVTILGGMMLQYPVGRLSDLIDRRLVLIGISFIGLLISMILASIAPTTPLLYFSLYLLLGGATFTLYPLSISHACDHLEPKDIIAGCQGLMLSYSIGSCIGPLIASKLLYLSTHGLIYFFAFCLFILMIFFITRLFQRVAIISSDDQNFIPVPRTTPVTAEIDPRSNIENTEITDK